MSSAVTIKCYIEEYENEDGLPSARLREKHTKRKVSLGATSALGKAHFLRFLQAAQLNRAAIPDAFSSAGLADCVEVSGDIEYSSATEVRFVNNENLSYLFG